MTRPARLAAAWLVAPLAVGSLAVSADWALRHDPLHSAAATTGAAQLSPRTAGLQHRAQLAARRLQRSQTALLSLEESVQHRSSELSLLHADVAAIRKARRTGKAVPLPGGGTAGSAVPAAPLPPPVAVPAPQVSTTTGAS